MTVSIELETADRDMVLLALAILSLDRPGWLEHLRELAGKVGGGGPDANGGNAFDRFRGLNADRWEPQRLVGKRVRWNHLPDSKPLIVESCNREGMLTVSGFVGEFAPHLFTVVEP